MAVDGQETSQGIAASQLGLVISLCKGFCYSEFSFVFTLSKQ